MSTSDVVLTDEPHARLSEAVADALETGRKSMVRVEIGVDPVDALTWLNAQPWSDLFFWSGRDDGLTMAGAGIADLIECHSVKELEGKLQPRLDSADPDIRYFGSVRFRPDTEASMEWHAFGKLRFVLPRVELRVLSGEATLAINVRPGESEAQLQAELERTNWNLKPVSQRTPTAIRRDDLPDRLAWHDSVNAALGSIRTTDLQKVVLARRSSFLFDESLDPFGLLEEMRAASQDCFHALIGLGQGTEKRRAFITATPELLFRLEDGEVISEAIAGTRPRSSDEEQDRLLCDELLRSEKDRREQTYVLTAIRSALMPLTEQLDAEKEPSAFNLTNGRHLRTIVKGSLDERTSVYDLLQHLHPTPAVGGSPLVPALSAIAKHEAFDRGLYAGPIGWIGRDAAEFAVGIRSGLIEDSGLHLYSGAGIVEGSEAEEEWNEIEHKLDDFRDVLGLEG